MSDLWWTTGAPSPGVLVVRSPSYINSPEICVYEAWLNCAGELLYPFRSTIFPLDFDAPAPEELAVLEFLSTSHACDWFRLQPYRVTGDCGLRHGKACCLSEALLEYFQDFRTLRENFSTKNLSCYYPFITPYCTVFYIILVFRRYTVSLRHSTAFQDRLKWLKM